MSDKVGSPPPPPASSTSTQPLTPTSPSSNTTTSTVPTSSTITVPSTPSGSASSILLSPTSTLATSNINREGSTREPLSPSHSHITSTTTTSASTLSSKRKRTFTKELKHMMFGFGDVRDPLPESVDLMEEIVFEYIQEMTLKAAQVSTKRGRFQTEDLVFLVRKDPKKYYRVIELLKMNEELKVAKRAFDDTQEPEG